jgi:hypothetical protein
MGEGNTTLAAACGFPCHPLSAVGGEKSSEIGFFKRKNSGRGNVVFAEGFAVLRVFCDGKLW